MNRKILTLSLAIILQAGYTGMVASPIGEPVASQQTMLAKGNVTDANGEPLIGAKVVIEGTEKAVSTDIDGNFAINAAPGTTLVISYVGFVSQKVKVTEAPMEIVMNENSEVLDEVVVIGYGTMRKRDVTGSVASVKAKDLNTVSAPNVNQMLQGKVAGMSAIQSSAQPGAGMSITIRGAASPSGSNAPLYVIDGVPMQTNSTADPGITGIDYKTGVDRDPLNSINPNDIESIEVLKDASAAAIYGASAANGVVLITTKSGKEGRVNVEYRSVYTAQIKKSYPKVLGAKDFREMVNLWGAEYYLYANKMGAYGDNPVDLSGYNPMFADVNGYTADTDWIGEVSRNGYILDQNVSVNGGTEKTKYYFSYNFYDNVGMLKNSSMKRNTIRLNLDQQFSKIFKGGIKMTYSNVVSNSTSVGDHGKGDNMLVNAFRYAPDIPVFDENGRYSRSYNNLINNPASFNEIEDKTTTDRIFLAPTLEANIIDGLKVSVVGGFDQQSSSRKFYIPAAANQAILTTGFGSRGFAKVQNFSVEAYASYNKSFGGIHNISAVLGAGWYKTTNEGDNMGAFNFMTDAFGVDNIGIASDKTREVLGSWRSERTKLSQFARINYSLMDRYIITLTARRDGSSYFAENNKWGIFPSASVAWRISEEGFMRGQTVMNELKLRVGYGATGNENVLGTNSLTLYKSGYNALFGNTLHTGLALTQAANPDLKWETDYTFNVGLDFGFFSNRINGSVEYFHRGVKDLLDYQQLPSNNAVGRVAANVGETKSEGFELYLQSNNLSTTPFTWETTLNVSYFKTSWVKRNPQVALADYIGEKDEIDAIYGWLTDGIIESKEDIPSYMPNANVGNVKYVDLNNDGVLDSKDVTKIGHKNPRWYVGLGNTFAYKGFDLNFYFYGAFGNSKTRGQIPDLVAIGNSGLAPGNTYDTILTEVWNSQTGQGWMPGVAANPYDNSNPSGVNNFYYMSGSYVKLKNITLGYSMPASIFENSKSIKGLRLFVDAQNVFTITKYKGFDPELYTTNPYPQALSLSFGVNLNF
ncbi:MAG: TonB-dependent receptor [Clostridium sp.]|nr:TonB-dependent receptor [Clostridium sp.]